MDNIQTVFLLAVCLVLPAAAIATLIVNRNSDPESTGKLEDKTNSTNHRRSGDNDKMK